jgi:hypothetical protein
MQPTPDAIVMDTVLLPVVRSVFINARSLIGRSVTSLHIKNNGVDNTMLIAMASAWKVHARSVKNQGGDLLRLKQLDLSGNPAIGDAGVVELASSIEVGAAPALEWLSVAQLGFGSDGAKAIALSLGSASCAVETLVLSGNRVGVAGKSAVAEALGQQSCSLTDLQMSRMQWDCDGAALLATALGLNSKLLSLDLGGNALGLKGICTLGWALSESNQTLISLQLWNNSGLSISGSGAGEEQSDIDEVLRTIRHTLQDNVSQAGADFGLLLVHFSSVA